MIIAIDGPAGSGKSTLAKAVAKTLAISHLDTGALYRCVTFECLQNEVDIQNEEAVVAVCQSLSIEFSVLNNEPHVFLNGQDVTQEIRTSSVDSVVSIVAAYPKVRAALLDFQRAYAKQADVVCEGRDIGTVVFPNADLKVFLSADLSVRAKRRAMQKIESSASEYFQIDLDQLAKSLQNDLSNRDHIDSKRKAAPLIAAKDARMLDTTSLTIEDEVQQIVSWVREIQEAKGSQKVNSHNEIARNSEMYANHKASKKPDVMPSKKETQRKLCLFKSSTQEYFDTPTSEYPGITKLFLSFMAYVILLVTKLYTRWEFLNRNEFVATLKKQPQVVIMNHVSNLDPVVPVISAYLQGVSLRPIYKSEYNDIPLLRWFFSRLGGIPVNRNTADLKAVRRAQKALESGESILIFPEGTRVKKGEESHYHGGFALIAQLAQVPVLPVAIVGAQDLTPRGKHFPRPGKVVVQASNSVVMSEDKSVPRKKRLAQFECDSIEALKQQYCSLHKAYPELDK